MGDETSKSGIDSQFLHPGVTIPLFLLLWEEDFVVAQTIVIHSCKEVILGTG